MCNVHHQHQPVHRVHTKWKFRCQRVEATASYAALHAWILCIRYEYSFFFTSATAITTAAAATAATVDTFFFFAWYVCLIFIITSECIIMLLLLLLSARGCSKWAIFRFLMLHTQHKQNALAAAVHSTGTKRRVSARIREAQFCQEFKCKWAPATSLYI